MEELSSRSSCVTILNQNFWDCLLKTLHVLPPTMVDQVEPYHRNLEKRELMVDGIVGSISGRGM